MFLKTEKRDHCTIMEENLDEFCIEFMWKADHINNMLI